MSVKTINKDDFAELLDVLIEQGNVIGVQA